MYHYTYPNGTNEKGPAFFSAKFCFKKSNFEGELNKTYPITSINTYTIMNTYATPLSRTISDKEWKAFSWEQMMKVDLATLDISTSTPNNESTSHDFDEAQLDMLLILSEDEDQENGDHDQYDGDRYFGVTKKNFIPRGQAKKKSNQEKRFSHFLGPKKDSNTMLYDTMKTPQPEKKHLCLQRGICWYKRTKKWVVQIKVPGQAKRKHIGYFASLNDAITSYTQACSEYGCNNQQPTHKFLPEHVSLSAKGKLFSNILEEPSFRNEPKLQNIPTLSSSTLNRCDSFPDMFQKCEILPELFRQSF